MIGRPALKTRLPPDRLGCGEEGNVSALLGSSGDVPVLLGAVEEFQGACLDIGAELTVVGLPQAKAYLSRQGDTRGIRAAEQRRVYRFGAGRHPAVGAIPGRIPVTGDFCIPLVVDVIDLNVPLLLGLDVLDAYKIYVNNTINRLVFVNKGVSVPVVRKMGHIYYEWGAEAYCTFPELQRIHRHFFYARSERLYAMMQRATDEHAVPQTLQKLQDVGAAYDVCQSLAKEPSRFRVALPQEDVCFNRMLYLDLMFLEGKAVLHVVDTDTLLSGAVFMSEGQSSDAVWDLWLDIWVSRYVGCSEEVHVDYGSQLRSDRWRALLSGTGVKLRESGVESHNALGAGERYHAVLRQIFRRVRGAHPGFAKEKALSLAVWAMNQTAGPSGLSPVLLVFGIHPRLPVRPVDLPPQRERRKALVEARADMVKLTAQARLAKALRAQVPRAAKVDIAPAMRVLVYREKPRMCEGPFTVVSCDNKHVWLDIKDRLKLFSLDKVKEYTPPLNKLVEPPPGPPAAPQASGVAARAADAPALQMSGPPSPEVQPAETGGDANLGAALDGIIAGDAFLMDVGRSVGLLKGKIDRASPEAAAPVVSAYLTEVLKPGDPRITSPEVQAARAVEVEGLMTRGAFKKVHKSRVLPGAVILGGRFVDAIKNAGTID